MWKAIVAAIVVYAAVDAAGGFMLRQFGLAYLHAFIAMFCGMFVGGYMAGRNFIGIAVALNLGFSLLNYVIVARMREQSVIGLILEQHPMVTVGSFAGAILGAWLGGRFALQRRAPA